MRIDINFQSLAQNVKYKTISNPLEKRKTISTRGPQPRGPSTRSARDPQARPTWDVAHPCKNGPRREGPCAPAHLQKRPHSICYSPEYYAAYSYSLCLYN